MDAVVFFQLAALLRGILGTGAAIAVLVLGLVASSSDAAAPAIAPGLTSPASDSAAPASFVAPYRLRDIGDVRLRVRTGPGVHHETLHRLAGDAVVMAHCSSRGTVVDDDPMWLYGTSNGATGWVAARYVDILPDAAAALPRCGFDELPSG